MIYGGVFRIVKRTNYYGVRAFVVQKYAEGWWQDAIGGNCIDLEQAREVADKKYSYYRMNTYFPDEVVVE